MSKTAPQKIKVDIACDPLLQSSNASSRSNEQYQQAGVLLLSCAARLVDLWIETDGRVGQARVRYTEATCADAPEYLFKFRDALREYCSGEWRRVGFLQASRHPLLKNVFKNINHCCVGVFNQLARAAPDVAVQLISQETGNLKGQPFKAFGELRVVPLWHYDGSRFPPELLSELQMALGAPNFDPNLGLEFSRWSEYPFMRWSTDDIRTKQWLSSFFCLLSDASRGKLQLWMQNADTDPILAHTHKYWVVKSAIEYSSLSDWTAIVCRERPWDFEPVIEETNIARTLRVCRSLDDHFPRISFGIGDQIASSSSKWWKRVF